VIWNFCIRRPVLTLVVFLAIAIFGAYGWQQMPVREIPEIDFPIVSVNVLLPGAGPEVIETEIIEPLESQLNTIEGLKELTATAREQVAVITAEFELWRDIDVAVQDVRDRVQRSRRELPLGIEPPIVRKIDPDARAIMWISLIGDERWDAVAMTEYADETLKEQLENLRGVGQIQIGGERKYAVRIRLDPHRLAAHRLTVRQVVAAVQANNVDIPAGRIESQQREFLVKTRGQFASPEPFNRLIIADRPGGVVRLADVGRAVAGVEDDRLTARFSGQTAVGLGVVKQSDANTVALADAVRQRMKKLAADFPAGLRYRVATDDSRYIRDSIDSLLMTILLATGLVVLVVLLFLRSFAGTFIPSLAIPTSLLGGLALMHLLGFSLNNLTLMGLILVIGIVVDDAIVIVESNYRHLERGAEPKPAARTGTTEVAFAAIANSLALAAVFIPVAFTQGLIGRFFYEFGLTVALTVFASTLTALTLTPMLCSRILRAPARRGRVFETIERGLAAFERAYVWTLRQALGHRALALLAGVGALALGLLAFRQLETEFIPTVDRSGFMITFETPEGATLSATDAYARELEALLAATDEVEHQFLAIGLARAGPGQPNQGVAFVHLVPPEQRRRHQVAVMQQLREKLAELPGGTAAVLEGGGGPGGQAPLQIVLQARDLVELDAQQQRLMAWMRDRPEFTGVNSNLKLNKPQLEVDIDRDKTATLGLSVADISDTLRTLLGEPTISEIERGSDRYEVITEMQGQGRLTPEALGRIHVHTRGGRLVSLDNVLRVEEVTGPSAIQHYNRRRAATISASPPAGVALGTALAEVERRLETELPAGFDYTVTGMARDFEESFAYLALAMVFAVVFIYLVLAAQFESFLHPLTILLALPLASIGAFGGLWLLGMTLNIYSFIGLIMLLGMATKNAILLIDYTNVLRRRGRALFAAVREASRVRFRPVIMTTFSTVLGLAPIALAYGAGGQARAPLGVAVGAGLLVTTFLTLVVIPVVYTLFDRLRQAVIGLVRRSDAEAG
jgi:hydrophobe/amphiphile efflux-1 (HAE1) family protein